MLLINEEDKVMLKRIFTGVCLLGFLVPGATSQGVRGPVRVDDMVSQNLCIPNLEDERLYEETSAIALDDNQLERLRIELLERGYDPGFDLDAADADVRLAQALSDFQAEFSLPVTGEADAATLN